MDVLIGILEGETGVRDKREFVTCGLTDGLAGRNERRSNDTPSEDHSTKETPGRVETGKHTSTEESGSDCKLKSETHLKV